MGAIFSKEIILTQGHVALVDADMFKILSQKKWRFLRCGSVGYAARTERGTDGRRYVVLMHRLMCSAPDGYVVDHINGNSLDNRRVNLRAVTPAQNSWRQKSKNPLSRGIRMCAKTGKYRASIMFLGTKKQLGTFSDLSSAMAAYSAAARSLYGEFAPDE